MYAKRRLLQGHPDIERKALETYQASLHAREDHAPEMDRLFRALDRLIDVSKLRTILVVGCGPEPETVRLLVERGYDAVGLEPVPSLVRAAKEYLSFPERIIEAAAEDIPLPTGSQDMVLAETVLEHVDSLQKTLSELYRVLAPGGLLYIFTTNRLRFNLLGRAEEFRVPFYNWLPALVKESYVHQHLHFDPSLANNTPRPAVHWYSYADLCTLGRSVGFHRFYSIIDLVDVNDRTVTGSALRRFLLRKAQTNPWIRALALSQYGGAIVMCKREESGSRRQRERLLGLADAS
jgi:SAM-dependent methyltransferase